MTLVDGSIGFLPRFMWCGRADIPGMPSSRAQDYWGAVTFFGAVLKAADVISAQPGSAQCGFAQPRLNLSGQRSKTDERHFVGWHYQPDATSRSGERRTGQQGAKISERLVHNLGNPCAEKVLQDRSRQNNVSEPALVAGVGGHWQGTLTITGSNVRLGTEMPVALSSFSI